MTTFLNNVVTGNAKLGERCEGITGDLKLEDIHKDH